jgi:hypothetical protein
LRCRTGSFYRKPSLHHFSENILKPTLSPTGS